ncbi:flavodoxin domain-containing protein [Lacticigenium naphthae]|uniref:flavodoxin domain-containing protein n=1 Tax=Lacticigenium naphthae TaxID=515351 RepID=UPI00040F7090|nr:flavodoxin domain-containing protein [Lacticigenium naphthae]
MKNIVLYKSKYGHTFQYASWIAEELNWEIRDFSKFKKTEIKDYDTIIFGSGVYMGKMNKVKKVLEWFKDKPIIIFACAGNNNVEKDIADIKNNNFNEDQLAFHTFFYLPGGIDFSKVRGIIKIFLNIFIKNVERKKNKTEDEEGIIESYYHPTNYVDKKHIEALVAYAKKL